MAHVRQLLKRLIVERAGQDLVEYALLAALVGVAGAASAPTVELAMRAAYIAWNQETQNLWVPRDPAP